MNAPEKKDNKSKHFIFDAQSGSWTVEDESAYLDLIAYNYPENAGCTPFSSNPYYHHFAEANGLTFLGDYNDFKSPYTNEGILNTIPMGYKVILVYERVCLYDNGKLIFDRELPETENSNDSFVGKYSVFTNKLQRIFVPSHGGYEVLRYEVELDPEDKLHWATVKDIACARKAAEDISIKDNARCVVCKIVLHADWH